MFSEFVVVCFALTDKLRAVLLTRFGSLTTKRDALQAALLPMLLSTRQATRRRAIDCIALLAVHEPDDLFKALIAHLVGNTTKSGSKVEHKRTMIQCFAAISRCVGYKLGPYLKEVVPLVVTFCDTDAADEDLRENCLQCFETLINRCPKDIAPFLDNIEKIALKYLSFDPNYAGDDDAEAADDDDDQSKMQTDGDGFDDDQLSDEAYSDDDDMSWKVRRACAKCLAALVDLRPERIITSYERIAPRLISRFDEREENVKLDVFDAARALLRQTRRTANAAAVRPCYGVASHIHIVCVSSSSRHRRRRRPSRRRRRARATAPTCRCSSSCAA